MVKKKNMVDGPTLNTQTENMLSSELFMNEHYLIRRNVLNGKVEFKTKNADDSSQQDNGEGYRTLTKEALNSMIISAKREQVNEREVSSRRLSTMCTLKRFLPSILSATIW